MFAAPHFGQDGGCCFSCSRSDIGRVTSNRSPQAAPIEFVNRHVSTSHHSRRLFRVRIKRLPHPSSVRVALVLCDKFNCYPSPREESSGLHGAVAHK